MYLSGFIINSLEVFFRRFPPLSSKTLDVSCDWVAKYSKICGWVFIYGSILFFAIVLASLVSTRVAISSSQLLYYFLLAFCFFVSGILWIKAAPLLKERKLAGWMLMFWAFFYTNVTVIAKWFTLDFSLFEVLAPFFIFYALFQMKSKYK